MNRPPAHSGEILKENVLPALGLSVSEEARRLGCYASNSTVSWPAPIPLRPKWRFAFGKFAGNGPAIWLRLQQAYGLWHAERRMKTELNLIESEKGNKNG